MNRGRVSYLTPQLRLTVVHVFKTIPAIYLHSVDNGVINLLVLSLTDCKHISGQTQVVYEIDQPDMFSWSAKNKPSVCFASPRTIKRDIYSQKAML